MKDIQKFPPRQKILAARLAERCQGNYPPGGKVMGSGAQMGKRIKEYPGLGRKILRLLRCRGLNDLG